MLKERINSIRRKIKYPNVEFDMSPLKVWLDEVNSFDFTGIDSRSFVDVSNEIRKEIYDEQAMHSMLPKAYALVKEAVKRIFGFSVHDEQVYAAIGLHMGRMVEMQTGEGKTICAVFPAYLNALAGEGVHVLTFNDYLAKRDAEWMGPIYRMLGLSVGYVVDGITNEERKKAYACNITYMTAREAGFDYLRGFLADDPSKVVQPGFNFAIIDEADSILIDEARIPMVIAGKTDTEFRDVVLIADIVDKLRIDEDYELDEYERNVYLAEKGLARVEAELGCGNLYNGKNNALLAELNNALHAKVLLKRDIDYIVRNGRIELVDEFTGRVAEKRHWPYGLHEAVEAKEGIRSEKEGRILASITLQNFIKQYPKISGMTGTALSSAEEFYESYGLKVMVVPTHKPCIRKDYPDVIYTHKEAKFNGIVSEIVKVHKTGQPVLVGTSSIEESEKLAAVLDKVGVSCKVLNAKNDELEAKIIADAGALYSITVSTNMAGRGTDIKLGGEGEKDKAQVEALGGLYVIGTNRHESRRIDNQLRGRSGRQGDPGTSRFFISLEDDLMLKYKLKDLIPESLYPKNQDQPLDNPVIAKKAAAAQRIIEGQNFEMRRTLNRYWQINEHQRQIVYNWHNEIMYGAAETDYMKTYLPDRYNVLCSTVGIDGVRKAEKQIVLFYINQCWMDYLDYLSYIRESIHLVNLAKEVPIFEYNKRVVDAFENFKLDIQQEIVDALREAKITVDGVDMGKEGLNAPSSTWTYMIEDQPLEMGLNAIIQSPLVMAFNFPLYLIALLYHRLIKKKSVTE